MSNKGRGIQKEREVKKELSRQGYLATRSRGSFGIFDIIAMNNKQFRLIQVKRTNQKYYSYAKEERELREFKNCPVGTKKELWIYLDRIVRNNKVTRKACRIIKVIE